MNRNIQLKGKRTTKRGFADCNSKGMEKFKEGNLCRRVFRKSLTVAMLIATVTGKFAPAKASLRSQLFDPQSLCEIGVLNTDLISRIINHQLVKKVVDRSTARQSMEAEYKGIKGVLSVSSEEEIYVPFKPKKSNTTMRDVMESLSELRHRKGVHLRNLQEVPKAFQTGSEDKPVAQMNANFKMEEASDYYDTSHFLLNLSGIYLRTVKVEPPKDGQSYFDPFYNITLKLPLEKQGPFLVRLKINFKIKEEDVHNHILGEAILPEIARWLVIEMFNIKIGSLRRVGQIYTQREEFHIVNENEQDIGFLSVDKVLIAPIIGRAQNSSKRYTRNFSLEIELFENEMGQSELKRYLNSEDFNNFISHLLFTLRSGIAPTARISHEFKADNLFMQLLKDER